MWTLGRDSETLSQGTQWEDTDQQVGGWDLPVSPGRHAFLEFGKMGSFAYAHFCMKLVVAE